MTDLEMRKLAECTREELIDMIIRMDKQLESNNSLKESIAKGIKEGLTPSNNLDVKAGQVYVKSDNIWSFQDCNYATINQLDDFKKLAKEAQELNKEIDLITHNKFVDYKFISNKDDRFKIGILKVLDPFSVTQEEIDNTKEIIKNLKLLMNAFEYGFDVFAKEHYFNALNDVEYIATTRLNLKEKRLNLLLEYTNALRKDWNTKWGKGSF